MEILQSVADSGVDISSTVEVLSYTSTKQMLVSSRLILSGIEGSSSYTVRMYVNGIEVYPDPVLAINSNEACFQSRAIWVDISDEISIRAGGTINDTAIDVDCILVDVSPPSVDELTDRVNDLSAELTLYRQEQLRLYDRDVLGA